MAKTNEKKLGLKINEKGDMFFAVEKPVSDKSKIVRVFYSIVKAKSYIETHNMAVSAV